MTIYFSDNLSLDTQKALSQCLANFQHESLKKDLLALNAVKKIEKGAETLRIELQLPFAWGLGFAQLQAELSDTLLKLAKCQHIKWHLSHRIATLQRANQSAPIKGVKNIIAVSSGKGGVGKSTVSVNLALALQALGAKVGILDADIYGPSIPLMLGVMEQRPSSPDNKHMLPIKAHHLLANSIGFLMSPENATIWRGPVASGALTQLASETLWAENGQALDYLVIDMPPGTGDIQLTLSQQIPVTGAIIVTTPQDVALLDAMKGVQMFKKVNIPVLGIVENMAMHICSHCGHQEAIFGTGGAEKMAQKYDLPLLSQQPLHIQLREDMDNGTPTMIKDPAGDIAQSFLHLAQKVTSQLYWQGQVIPSEILITEL